MSVSKNKKQFAGSEKTNPAWGGGIANLRSVESGVWRDFGREKTQKNAKLLFLVISLHKLLFVLSG